MVTVPLPCVARHQHAMHVKTELDAAGIEVPILPAADGLTLRVSAQVYCGREDIERLAEAVVELA